MTSLQKLYDALHEFAMAFPETQVDHPLGWRAYKASKSTFLFLKLGADRVTLTVKLPQSAELALTYHYVEPTGSLGHHGWVSVKIDSHVDEPLDMFEAWIDESYRAVAPRKHVALL